MIYKRSIVLLCLCLMMGTGLSYGQGFKGGLTFGITGSQINGDDIAGYDKFGLMAGVFVYTTKNPEQAFKTGAYYIGKGSRKRENPDQGDYHTIKNHLDYVEIPFLYLYRWERFSAEGGLAAAYLIRGFIEEDGYRIHGDYNFNPYDFSAILGMNFMLSEQLSSGLRLSYSVLPIRSETRNWFNNSLLLSLNYEI